MKLHTNLLITEKYFICKGRTKLKLARGLACVMQFPRGSKSLTIPQSAPF